ncbi:MAG: acyltransferase family protein [Proteobacteria bacterium]|nr:acyltransferase family protein [Pseudomonadota bacterium]
MSHMSKQERNDIGLLDDLLDTIGGLILKGGSTIRAFREDVLGDLEERLSAATLSIGEEGVDPFGMDPAALLRTAIGGSFLYKVYFRCLSKGQENVPDGPVILVANHAGQLPIDAVMITAALVLDKDPPRFARSLVDRWVPSLPFVSTFYSRVGMAVGSSENAQRLLSRGEALLVFPEGMEAISKTVEQAYQLKPFSSGFMRLALSTKTPVVPVAVVGSEEQYPTLYNLKGLGKVFGLPAVPIWAQMIIPVLGLLPLPVRYRLQFGEPMHFDGDPDDEDAVVQHKVDQVKDRVKELVNAVRAERKSVFF